jgi:hypothetical protein
MNKLLAYLWVLVSFSIASIQAQTEIRIEDFSSHRWQNHEDLGESITTEDLIIEVNLGGSLKGLTTPVGIQLGYLKTSSTYQMRITPRSSPYMNLKSLEATDLWQMETPEIVIKGFRDTQLIAEITTGELWNDALKTGIVQLTDRFEGLTHVEVHSNLIPSDSGDMYFILESIEYQLKPSIDTPKPLPPPFLGSAGWIFLCALGLLLIKTGMPKIL